MIANGAISRVQRYKKMLNKFNLDEKQISMNVFAILATKLMTQIDIMMKQPMTADVRFRQSQSSMFHTKEKYLS